MFHARIWRIYLLSFVMLMLSNCATVATTKPDETLAELFKLAEPFGPRPPILSPKEFHQLGEAQVKDFRQYFEAPHRAQIPRHRRLAEYIVQRVAHFDYNADTLTAEQVFLTNSGNCLSLALMTTALARLAGVEVEYQLMDDEPVFEFDGSTIEKGVHVRTKLINPEWTPKNTLLFDSSGIAIDYFPTGRARFISNIGESEYLAMYYRNLAVESLQLEDLNTAYWLSVESLEYAPDHPDALNLLAIVNRRAGNPRTAEQIYLYALAHAQSKLSLLKNYRVLLRSENRLIEAAEIDRQLEKIYDPSPFNWFHLARSAYDEADYERAISYYQRALDIAPYLHEARLGIALSYVGLGQVRDADTALISAIANANSSRTRQRYKEKLYALRYAN